MHRRLTEQARNFHWGRMHKLRAVLSRAVIVLSSCFKTSGSEEMFVLRRAAMQELLLIHF